MLAVIICTDDRPAAALIPGRQRRVDEESPLESNSRGRSCAQQRAAHPVTSGRFAYVQGVDEQRGSLLSVSDKSSECEHTAWAAFRYGHQRWRAIGRVEEACFASLKRKRRVWPLVKKPASNRVYVLRSVGQAKDVVRHRHDADSLNRAPVEAN